MTRRVAYWDGLDPMALLATTRLIVGLGLVTTVLLNLYVEEESPLTVELDRLIDWLVPR